MSNFTEEFIKKWESHYGIQHRGLLELSEGKNMVYYDQKFVLDILKYAEKLYKKSQEAKAMALDILQELKDGAKNKELRGVAAKVASMAGESNSVADTGPDKEEENKEESTGDVTPAKESDLSSWGESIPQGLSVSHQVSGQEYNNA